MLLALLALTQAPAAASPLAAEPPAVHSGRRRELAVAIPRVEAEITVDGVLDEAVWRQAPILTDFSQFQPVDGLPAVDSIEVRVWYSPTAIHFGVHAFEPHGEVQATLADRDRIFADDYIQFFLGTFNDGRQAFMFAVNPLGVQADGALVERGQVQGGGFMGGAASSRESADLSPDYVFESKGHLVEGGYVVEAKIPFKSFRYRAAETQTWQLHVMRYIQHSAHEDSWVPAERASASFLGQSGTLVGLQGLERGLTLDITPEVTGRWDGAPAGSSWDYTAQGPEVGGTVRWGITSNLSLNGAVNPDYSQIESDVTQIQFDPRDALFYPEKRPFFLDGLELFQSPNNLIYTRRIVQPEGAVKLAGKVGGSDVGLISAVDNQIASATGEDNPILNILRLQKDVGGRSRAGLVYTDRIDGDDYNRVAAADTRLVFGKSNLRLQYGQSWTREGGQSLTGPLWEARFNHSGKLFGARYGFTGVDPDFRTRSGFIQRTGDANLNLVNLLTFNGGEGAFLEKFTPDISLIGRWIYDSLMDGAGIRDKLLHFNTNATLRGGWGVGASLLVETFGYDPRLYQNYYLEVPGPGGVGLDTIPFTGEPTLNNLDWVLSASTPEFGMFSANVLYLWGQDENFYEWSSADIVFLDAGIRFRPTDKVRLEGRYRIQDFIRRSDDTRVARLRTPRLKLEYQIARPLFVRLTGEYVAYQQDDLRDDGRTDAPILIYSPSSGNYNRATGYTSNTFSGDVLLSFTPVPGTVVFAGYGSTRTGAEAFKFDDLDRVSDGFFAKVSYLFRVGG
ncbi:MAG: carbohydrate binding family 9 domain-containing protein [Gemmatimonadota bacterium]|nr:carbohydrate binding family 9 domain-containing protein [Gemmatimonadota bacterium]